MDLGNGNNETNWAALAKVFVNSMKNPIATKPISKQNGRNIKPGTLENCQSRKAARNVGNFRAKHNTDNGMVHQPTQCAGLAEFEKLRMEMLHQLVIYQRKLLALQMPQCHNQCTQSIITKNTMNDLYSKSKTINQKKSLIEHKKWEKMPDSWASYNKLSQNKLTIKSNSKKMKIKSKRSKPSKSDHLQAKADNIIHEEWNKSIGNGSDIERINLNSVIENHALSCNTEDFKNISS